MEVLGSREEVVCPREGVPMGVRWRKPWSSTEVNLFASTVSCRNAERAAASRAK